MVGVRSREHRGGHIFQLCPSLGLCLLGTRWEIPPREGGFAALAHSPGGSLVTVAPGRSAGAGLGGTGGRPASSLRAPWPPAALAASRKLLDLCMGLSALQTVTALPTPRVGRLGDNDRRGHCFPCGGKASFRGGQVPHTKGFPGGRKTSLFLLPACSRPSKDEAWGRLQTGARSAVSSCLGRKARPMARSTPFPPWTGTPQPPLPFCSVRGN